MLLSHGVSHIVYDMQKKVLVDRTLETEDQDAVRFLTKVKERMERYMSSNSSSSQIMLYTKSIYYCLLVILAESFQGML